MAAINRKSWELGWLPSDDSINGRKNGLLRMDNLRLDEVGVLSSTRGISKINTGAFNGFVHTCFSKYFQSTKHRYVGLSDGTVLRNSGDFSSATTIISGGNPARAVFQDLLGLVVCSSGVTRKKDDTVNTYNLGVEVPATGLTITASTQPTIQMGNPLSSWTAFEGTGFATVNTNIVLTTDSTTLRSVAQLVYSTPKNTIGTKNVNNDTFEVALQIGDSEQLKFVRIEFLLEVPGADTIDIHNYYFFEIHNDDNAPFNRGVNQWSKIEISRAQFLRAGGDVTKDWHNVVAIRCIAVYKSTQATGWGDWYWFGGDQAQLKGHYDWIQTNCYDNGIYVAESPVGPSLTSGPLYVRNSSVAIDPIIPTDPQVNKIRIYRRNVDTQGAEEYYQILELTQPFGRAYDNLADTDAAILNLKPNLFMKSFKDLPDEIFGMVGIYYERLLALTIREVILSQPLNIDAYDPREVIRLSSNVSEKNCWIAKVSVGLIYVGTTHDIYEITGTLEALPDGTIDVSIKPLGVQYPPIGLGHSVDRGNIFYMAADGWRVTSGTATENISGALDLLYKGYTRYTIAPVLITPNLQVDYACAIAKGSLFTSCPNTDGTRRLNVYVFPREIDGKPSYWFPYYTDPISLFTEEDGLLLGGYGGGSGNYLREIDTASSNLLDGTTKQTVFFQTVYDDNDQPRNRKDTFTLKIVADSGGDPITISVAKDGTDTFVSLGSYTFNGYQTHYITIADKVGLGKRFALQITGIIASLKIYEFQLEYDPRPEQLTYLRIPNQNLGTVSRKRVVNFAFIIDTLGNTVTFTPLVDGVAQNPPSTVNYNRKGTFIHYFPVETVGTDVGGILSGTDETDVFEFYQVDINEIVSEKMPVPATFLLIPQDDYGSTSRKRFSSYKFRINTRGSDVIFTPHIDGRDGSPQSYNTSEPTVCEYYFLVDTFGINIGGNLRSNAVVPFEFYGALKPAKIEDLPERLEYFKIPENNYGVAARKRLRTIPMQINTYGFDVLFTPIIDGIADTPTIINTPSKRTTYHYFSHDVFGIDIAGELLSQGGSPFEFYGLMAPENVETLPVPKLFDQVGPIQMDKIGKLKQVRIRMVAFGTTMPITVYMEDEVIYQTTITTTPGEDRVYEFLVPKGTNGTVMRMEMGPTALPFHRWGVKFWAAQGGDSTQLKVFSDEDRNYYANLLRMGVAR